MPGTVVATALVCAAWGYLVLSGTIWSLWPMLGICNQLLACIALCAGTLMIVNRGKARYAWVTLLPLLFVGTVTETAGFQMLTGPLHDQIASPKPSTSFQGWLLSSICALAMSALLVIFVLSARAWWKARRSPAAEEAVPTGASG